MVYAALIFTWAASAGTSVIRPCRDLDAEHFTGLLIYSKITTTINRPVKCSASRSLHRHMRRVPADAAQINIRAAYVT